MRDTDAIRRYHRRTVHRPGHFAPGPGFMDWANEPDPFRRYPGAAEVPLPLADLAESPSWADLHEPGGVAPRRCDVRSLGAFLELALGLTAWKVVPGATWALRSNPSSGNLHPTEGYVLVPEAPGMAGGLYHYRSLDHVLEQRCRIDPQAAAEMARHLPSGAFLVGLASIHWREAWKYGERAFRYCQHDVGHALAAVRYAAAVQGWSARLLEAPGDEDIAALLGLDRRADNETLAPEDRESPAALIVVAPPSRLENASRQAEGGLDALRAVLLAGAWAGRPNPLGATHVAWAEIDAVSLAGSKPRTRPAPCAPRSPATRPPVAALLPAVGLIRQRRSAVAMDGTTAASSSAFFEIMERLVPHAGTPPWDVLPGTPAVHPVVFVHRVDGLAAGLYVLDRGASNPSALRASLSGLPGWQRVARAPATLDLFLLEEGDARSFATFSSCQQAIAGDSAFSVAMLGSFDERLDAAPWLYRRLFWEAGVLGHTLYLEAEAHGLRGTGIGCFFDDVVHEALGLDGQRLGDLYHFTVGGAIDDPRLATRPGYDDDVRRR